MKHARIFAFAFLGTALGGCTTLGTNINGSFRCDAPDGVCAPSTTIDDNALARIEETSSTELLNAAGPYQMDDGIDSPVHSSVIAEAAQVARPAPTYRLSVVFPGYTDAGGAIHVRKVVQTDVSLPGRGDAFDAVAMRGNKPSRSRGLLAAAESAPSLLAIAPGVLGAPVASAAGNETESASGAVFSGPNLIEQIEAQVAQRLSAQQQARRKAASFPGIVE